MCNARQFSNLQKLADFIRGNRNRVLDFLDNVRDQWEGKTATVPLQLETGIDSSTVVLCRVVTSGDLSRSRFCFHIRQGHDVVTDTYVAGGFLFQEQAPPVIVGTHKQLAFF